MNKVTWLAGGVALAALVAAGPWSCVSKTTGNEGNLQFAYFTDDDVRDFNKPIAVGARLELIVEQAGTGAAATVLEARSTDPGVLAVVSTTGNRVLLEGKGAGSAAIEVTARVSSGDTVSDSVDMLARVPEVVELSHTCSPDATAYYLTHNDIVVNYELKMANGQNVIGYGYHPVTVDPADALTLDGTAKDQFWLHYHTTTETGVQATVASTLDEATLTLVTVEESDFDGAKMYTTHDTLIDTQSFYYILPTVGGVPVCQARTAFTVTTGTPEVCEVTANPNPQSEGGATGGPKNEWGWVKVKGLAVGVCNVSITHTNGAAGAGVTTDFDVNVVAIVGPDSE